MEQIAPIRSTVIKSEAPQRHAAGLPISSDSSDCLLAPVVVPDVVGVGATVALRFELTGICGLIAFVNAHGDHCVQIYMLFIKSGDYICLSHFLNIFYQKSLFLLHSNFLAIHNVDTLFSFRNLTTREVVNGSFV